MSAFKNSFACKLGSNFSINTEDPIRPLTHQILSTKIYKTVHVQEQCPLLMTAVLETC